jgi:hypothetical protein
MRRLRTCHVASPSSPYNLVQDVHYNKPLKAYVKGHTPTGTAG